jgi:hypothetical protein
LTHTIDGAAYRLMMVNAAAAISQSKQQINELNVFPVPDGDTGTNMSLTMDAAAAELNKHRELTASKAAGAAASALLRGARGNSGVILSLLFRGFAKSVKDMDEIDALAFATAMNDGVEAAYKAVMKPAEGTILTVSRLASAGAFEIAAEGEDDIEKIIERALETGGEALADTVNQNPVLKKAGVIDAGGKGYLIILEGMLKALRGEKIEAEAPADTKEKADFAGLTDEDITFTFDTVFIVRKTANKSIEPFRAYLNSIGDSLVIGEDDEAFKVHVHTDIPGAALTEAQKYGTLELAKIENMRTQYEDMAAGRTPQSTDDLDDDHDHSGEEERKIAPAEKPIGAVAVCAGDGMAAVFRDLGVDGIITGGQTMNPSTEDILREIDRTPAETVFVLPNNKNIIMAAQQCVPLSEKKVVVISSKTVPQGITAMMTLDTSASPEENAAAMEEAVKAVHTVQITYAARDSDFDGFEIKAGEYLALLESGLIGSSSDLNELLDKVAERLKEFSPEFINIFYGENVTEADAEEAAGRLTSAMPDAEAVTVNGGQPVYYYVISAE